MNRRKYMINIILRAFKYNNLCTTIEILHESRLSIPLYNMYNYYTYRYFIEYRHNTNRNFN